ITFSIFHDTASTQFYTLSLHDALPISRYCRPKLPTTRPCRSGSFLLSGATSIAQRAQRKGTRGKSGEQKRREFDQRLNSASNLRSEEHTSELQSRFDLVCRLLLEKKKK